MRDDEPAGERQEDLPPLADILEEVLASPQLPEKRLQKEFEEDFSKAAVRAELEWEHLHGLREHYKHKSRWSWFLMGLMGVMVLFQSILLIYVGIGKLSFVEYEWLLPALLVQNLGQIVGLSVFVVKALFKDIGSPT